MSSPAITQTPSATLAELTALLESRAISAVPIVDAGRLVGIVSTTDLLAAGASREEGLLARASDRMTSPVVTVGADEPLDAAARRLVEAHVHRVVVTDRDDVVGVLSARDVLEEVKRLKVKVPLERVMTTPVETVDIGESVDVAIDKLANARVHGLVVVDGELPVGVFTHAEALSARKLPVALRASPVEEVMSYETVCLDASTPVYRAAAYAVSMDVRRILVVRDRRLVGIASVVDLVAVMTPEA